MPADSHFFKPVVSPPDPEVKALGVRRINAQPDAIKAAPGGIPFHGLHGGAPDAHAVAIPVEEQRTHPKRVRLWIEHLPEEEHAVSAMRIVLWSLAAPCPVCKNAVPCRCKGRRKTEGVYFFFLALAHLLLYLGLGGFAREGAAWPDGPFPPLRGDEAPCRVYPPPALRRALVLLSSPDA